MNRKPLLALLLVLVTSLTLAACGSNEAAPAETTNTNAVADGSASEAPADAPTAAPTDEPTPEPEPTEALVEQPAVITAANAAALQLVDSMEVLSDITLDMSRDAKFITIPQPEGSIHVVDRLTLTTRSVITTDEPVDAHFMEGHRVGVTVNEVPENNFNSFGVDLGNDRHYDWVYSLGRTNVRNTALCMFAEQGPAGQLLALCAEKTAGGPIPRNFRIYDLMTGEQLLTLGVREPDYYAISADGTTATYCMLEEPVIRVAQISSADINGERSTLNVPCQDHQFLHDGLSLVFADGAVLNAADGSSVVQLAVPAAYDVLRDVMVSPGGDLLVLNADVYDLASGALLASLDSSGDLYSIGFTEDGTTLVLLTTAGVETWQVLEMTAAGTKADETTLDPMYWDWESFKTEPFADWQVERILADVTPFWNSYFALEDGQVPDCDAVIAMISDRGNTIAGMQTGLSAACAQQVEAQVFEMLPPLDALDEVYVAFDYNAENDASLFYMQLYNGDDLQWDEAYYWGEWPYPELEPGTWYETERLSIFFALEYDPFSGRIEMDNMERAVILE